VAGLHVRLEQHDVVVGLLVAELRDVLGRLPVGHARIVEPRGHEHGRIRLAPDPIVGRPRADRVERRRILDRVAPFRPFELRERQVLVEDRVEHVDEGHLRHGRAPELRRFVQDRTDERAARAAAHDRDAPLRRVLLLDERPSDVHEVVERVRALLQLARLVPVVAELVAAAHVRDRVHEAAIEQRQTRGREVRRHRHAVRAIGVEEKRCRAVLHERTRVDDRHRHVDAVARAYEPAFGRVAARVVARRHLAHLLRFEGARRKVVVEDRLRRHHRLVVEAQLRHLELGVVPEPDLVRRLWQCDVVLVALVGADADLVEPVLTLFDHHDVCEARDVHQVVVVGTLDDGLPIAFAWIGHGRAHHAKVGVRVVRADVEVVAALVDVVFVLRTARCDALRFCLGCVGGQVPDLARDVVAGTDEDPGVRRGLVDADEERALLLEDDHVVVRRRTEPVALRDVGTPVLREQRVEEGGVVVRPGEGATDPLDAVGQKLAGREVLHHERVALGAVGVGRVREVAVVGRERERAETEEVVALGERRLVEEDRFEVGPSRGPARPDLVLGAFARVPPAILVLAVLPRHGRLVRLLACDELAVQRVHEGAVRRQRCLEVGVLGAQVREDLGILDLRVRGVAQPEVGILELHVVVDGRVRLPCRDGWRNVRFHGACLNRGGRAPASR